MDQVLAAIRAAGPVPYFTAMALLPLPLSWFTVPAGEAFAPTMTLTGVTIAALAAVTVQTALCFAVARWGAGPALERWLARRKLTVPKLTPDNALMVIVLVRLVPGPPLPLQCFLLSLAGAPFALYMMVSMAFSVPWVVGGIVLGKGILSGNVTLIGAAAGVIGAAAIAAFLLRRRLAGRAAS
jgi:uncharacterized membrane protein YdjX (TVP38/TMEM64 family)